MFVDTSGWPDFADKKQCSHTRAVELVRAECDAGRRLVTTSYVLAELTALLTRPIRMPKPSQVVLLKSIRTADWVDVVPIDAELDAAAWRLWESRPDKDWSLVDCASFVVMGRRKLVEALTADHHFEQAGLTRLLK